MRAYAEVMTSEFGACLFRVGDTPLPPQSRRQLRKQQSKIDCTVRNMISQGIQCGELAPRDPKLAAFAIAEAINSVARWCKPNGELLSAGIAKAFTELLMAALLPPGMRKAASKALR